MSNPATRLHTILHSSKDQDKQSKPMIEGWKLILGLKIDVDDMLVVSKVGKVYALPSLISVQIRSYSDIQHDLYLRWRPDLSKAFMGIRYSQQLSNFSSGISDSLLMGIEFCAHELEKRMPEKNISEPELSSLREEAWKLYEDIAAADLDPILRQYLFHYVYLIVEAIDDFVITGARGLQTAVDSAIGTIVTQRHAAEAARNSQFGEDFWKVVAKAALIIDIAKSTMELAEGLFKALPQK
jgi:hypothetical protein